MNEQEIIKLYRDNGKSTYEISELFNTYPNKIRRILVRNNVDMKSKSEAQKNALKNGVAKIPTQGKKRSFEERLKISASQKKAWENMDKEKYDMHVNNAKRRWATMSDEQKESMRASAIKAIQAAGKDGSKLEKFLRKELLAKGFKVEIHKKDLLPNANLEIDLYIPQLKAIIEIDGPSHFLPIWGDLKLKKQMKSDSQKTGLILSKGFVIIRVKNLMDTVCLVSQENLKNQIIDILNDIESKFPPRSKRYIEIEV